MSRSQRIRRILWGLFTIPVVTFIGALYLSLHKALETDQPVDPGMITVVTLVVTGGFSILLLILGVVYVLDVPKIAARSSTGSKEAQTDRWKMLLVTVYLTVLFVTALFLTGAPFATEMFLADFVPGTDSLRLVVLASMDGLLVGAAIWTLISALDKKAIHLTSEGIFRYVFLYILCAAGLLVLLQLNETGLEEYRLFIGMGMVGLIKMSVWGINSLLDK